MLSTANERILHNLSRPPSELSPEDAFCYFRLKMIEIFQHRLILFTEIMVQHKLLSQVTVDSIDSVTASGIRKKVGQLLQAILDLIKHYPRKYEAFITALQDMNDPTLCELVEEMRKCTVLCDSRLYRLTKIVGNAVVYPPPSTPGQREGES